MSSWWNGFRDKYVTSGPMGWSQNDKIKQQNKNNQNAQNKQNQFITQQNKEDKDFVKYQMKNNMLMTAEQYKKLGINPLALAGQTGGVTQVSGTPQGAVADSPLNGFADNVQGGVGTALQVMNLQLLQKQLESVTLDNNYKQYQMEQIGGVVGNTSSVNNNSSSRVNSGLVSDTPANTTKTIGNNSSESGSNPANSWVKNSDGSWSTLPGENVKNRMEDSFIYQFKHFFLNDVKQLVNAPAPPDVDLKKDMKWYWDGFRYWQVPAFKTYKNSVEEIKAVKNDVKNDIKKHNLGKKRASQVNPKGYIGGYR